MLGVLAPFAADPAVTDLLVDGGGRLWLDAGAGLVVAPHWLPLDAAAARRLAVEIVASGGRHVDDATPCVDVRLPGGIRAHAVLPPVSTAGPLLSVRIARTEPWRLADLETAGMLSPSRGSGCGRPWTTGATCSSAGRPAAARPHCSPRCWPRLRRRSGS